MQNADNNSETRATISEAKITVKIEVASEADDQTTFGDELKICRVCLKENSFYLPIYGYVDLSADLCKFGDITVKPNDEYPKHLCQACYNALQSAVLFRKTAQQSDKILRKSTKQATSMSIKKEASNTPETATKRETKSTVKQELQIEFDNSNNSSDDKPSNDLDVEYTQEKKTERNFYKKSARCEKCNINFESVKDYLKHRTSNEHKKQKKPKTACSICNKNVANLEQHKLTHETSFICDVCGKNFPKRNQLNNHHVIHSFDLKHKCTLCPYKGRFKQCLEMHMLTHTGEKPYPCNLCPSRFSHRSNLNKHLRYHRGIRDFKCDQCPRDFYTKPELERHFKSEHLGIKEFVCNTCGKEFGIRKKLMKHQLKVHKREKMRVGRMPVYLLAEKALKET